MSSKTKPTEQKADITSLVDDKLHEDLMFLYGEHHPLTLAVGDILGRYAAPTLLDKLKREALDLQGKIDRLKAFRETDIYKGLDRLHKRAMTLQLGGMCEYSAALLTRIALFEAEEPEQKASVKEEAPANITPITEDDGSTDH